MKTASIIFLISITSLLHQCVYVNSDLQGRVSGNGKVTTESVNISSNFEAIHVATDIELQLSNGPTQLDIEADSNLHEFFEITQKNKRLSIKMIKPASDYAALRVHLTHDNIKSLKASTNARIYSNDLLETSNLSLEASTNAKLVADVSTKNLSLDASTGGNILLTGKAEHTKLEASTNAKINAEDFYTEHINIEAATGAHIKLNEVERHIDIACSTNSDVYIAQITDGNHVEIAAVTGAVCTIKQGRTEQLNIKASTNAKVLAEYVVAPLANIDAATGAKVAINCTEELIATAHTKGTIIFTGNPSVKELQAKTGGYIGSGK
ncbi:MAG: head GIN domain-containing protein [Flavobacteriaceae bacterium]|nr:head GIN domain-containing protein [Flavobacteriaceae bacterium]